MKALRTPLIPVIVMVVASPVLAETLTVDCTQGETLAKTVERAKPGDTIQVTGTCKETVTITTDRLILDGQGSAILDGGSVGQTRTVVTTPQWLQYHQGVLTIDGARGIVVTGFTIQHGIDGMTCINGATCIVRDTTLQDNADEGMQVSQNATAHLMDCTLQRNAEFGLVVFANSSVTFHGTLVSNHNGRDGISIAGASSAGTHGEVTLHAKHNALHGIAVRRASTLSATGTIQVEHNGEHGIVVENSSDLHGFRALFLVFSTVHIFPTK